MSSLEIDQPASDICNADIFWAYVIRLVPTFLISCGHHLGIFEDKLQDGRSFTAMYVTGFCDFCVLLRHYYSLFPRWDIQLSIGSITEIQKSKNINC
jgi:hypothetical protein